MRSRPARNGAVAAGKKGFYWNLCSGCCLEHILQHRPTKERRRTSRCLMDVLRVAGFGQAVLGSSRQPPASRAMPSGLSACKIQPALRLGTSAWCPRALSSQERRAEHKAATRPQPSEGHRQWIRARACIDFMTSLIMVANVGKALYRK